MDQFEESSARKLIAEALQLFRDLNDPLGICLCLEFEGDFACRERRWADAEALFGESLELGRKTGVDFAVGDALASLGRLAARDGNHGRAIELTGEAVAHYRDAHVGRQLCVVLNMFALAPESADDHKGAAKALIESLDLAEAHGFNTELDWIFRDIALVLPDELHDLAKKLWTPFPATWEYQLCQTRSWSTDAEGSLPSGAVGGCQVFRSSEQRSRSRGRHSCGSLGRTERSWVGSFEMED